MKRCLIIICLSLFLGGCASQDSNQSYFKSMLESLGLKSGNLETRIKEIEIRVMKLEFNNMLQNRDFVVLDPSERGYNRLDTSSGFFLVSCKGAEPYLDGYKILLNIGNPTTATYSGFKLKVQYGKQFDFNTMDASAWQKSLKTIESNFVNVLKPGSWNTVELILASTKPEEVRYICISMETDTVSLYTLSSTP